MLWKKLDGGSINGGTMRITFRPPGCLAFTTIGTQSMVRFLATIFLNMFLMHTDAEYFSKLNFVFFLRDIVGRLRIHQKQKLMKFLQHQLQHQREQLIHLAQIKQQAQISPLLSKHHLLTDQ